MSEATPELRSAYSVVQPMLGGDYRTSVIGLGKHVKNSAHYEGKAIDVAPPWTGDNKQTYDFIGRCVMSKRFAKIGVYPPLYEKMQESGLLDWAKSRGTEIFPDEGSGPHVHLQVP